MAAHEEEHTQPRPGMNACNICGREIRQPLLLIHGRVFCQEHRREFRRRRRKGVSAAELDSRWDDLLKNWRERPPELDKETRPVFMALSPRFQGREGPWLLFSRAYLFIERPHMRRNARARYAPQATLRLRKRGRKIQRPLHRLPDYLAINTQTGEIRPFVDVSEYEVRDDLLGIHPAPAQAELAPFWGKRQPPGIRERAQQQFLRQFWDERHHLHLQNLVSLLAFPLYGPADNPFGLKLTCSLSTRQGINYISSVGLVFSSPRYPHPSGNFEIESSDARERNVLFPTKDVLAAGGFDFDPDSNLFQTYLSEAQQARIGRPTSWEGDLIIAGTAFTGELSHWTQPVQLSRFLLRSEQIILSGSAYGFTQEELFQLLQSMQPLNHLDEVLSRYQQEYDEDWQRLRTR